VIPSDQPTPYADVNAILQDLLASVRAILNQNFAGLYLYGSLASGDFDPVSSDVDFVVATHQPIPAAQLPELEKLHQELTAVHPHWSIHLEGAYLPLADLRRYDPAGGPYPHWHERRFYVAGQGSDWIIQRHVLREWGVRLAGPPPNTLIDPVTPDDLRQAVGGVLAEWWAPMLDDPTWLHEWLYQAFAILTMCRALHTLETGTIASKPVAARWAMGVENGRFSPLITRALAWPDEPQPDALPETLELLRYTVIRSRAVIK
jgi:predicted nucleotidyltransferase